MHFIYSPSPSLFCEMTINLNVLSPAERGPLAKKKRFFYRKYIYYTYALTFESIAHAYAQHSLILASSDHSLVS